MASKVRGTIVDMGCVNGVLAIQRVGRDSCKKPQKCT